MCVRLCHPLCWVFGRYPESINSVRVRMSRFQSTPPLLLVCYDMPPLVVRPFPFLSSSASYDPSSGCRDVTPEGHQRGPCVHELS